MAEIEEKKKKKSKGGYETVILPDDEKVNNGPELEQREQIYPLPKNIGNKRKDYDKRIPTNQDLKQIEIQSSIGLNLATIAADIGISHDTLCRWQKEYWQVKASIERGIVKRKKRAYSCFFSQAFPIDENGRPTGKGDTSAMIFWMKTREKWKEPPKDIRVSGNTEAPIIEFCVKKEINNRNDT